VAAEEAAASEENLLRHPTAIMEEALRRSSCRGGRPGNILTLFTYYEARDERALEDAQTSVSTLCPLVGGGVCVWFYIYFFIVSSNKIPSLSLNFFVSSPHYY
jgi:hypothetical protein